MSQSLTNTFSKISRSLGLKNYKTILQNNILTTSSCLKYSPLKFHYRYAVDCTRELQYNHKILEPFPCFKFLRLIKSAIREHGPIVELNPRLASILTKAEEHNVPVEFIDFSIKISVDNRARSGIFELLYLNQGFFIIQYEDIDTSNTRHHLLQICQKYDATLIYGSVKWDQYFSLKGFLSVQESDSKYLKDVKEAQKVASQIGAVSVKKEIELDDWVYWQFQCEPEDLQKVKKELQKKNYDVVEAFVGFIPKQQVHLPVQVKRMTKSIISDINKSPVIDNLYTNIKL